MAATKYQVMYRYMNEITNVPITNNQSTVYEPTFEFYTDPDHRIFSENVDSQAEELTKQQQIISSANQSSNPKNDMLFVYDGCKKVSHKIWIEDQVGYVVRDWGKVRSKIGNRGDYSKDFTCLNAATPEDGATVVCTKAVFNKYYVPLTCTGGAFENSTKVQEMFDNSSIFAFINPNWQDHAKKTGHVPCYVYGNQTPIYYVATGKISVGNFKLETFNVYYKYYSNSYWTWNSITYTGLRTDDINANNLYDNITHEASQVETTTIPGHYEESTATPYCIKDQYKRIESSPWLINCVVGSLEAALIKAKKLIEMVGLENVKIVKVVAIDQFVKIK